MNGANYLVDTNIFLYILSGNEALVNHLQGRMIFAFFVSEIELLGFLNLTPKEEKVIRDILTQFRIVNVDEDIKREAIRLRRSYNLKLPDCLVAATAISLQFTLITANRQFRQIGDLLLSLYEP